MARRAEMLLQLLVLLLFGCLCANSQYFTPKTDYRVGSGPFLVSTCDLNRDGFDDILAANFRQSSVSILLNKGSGVFEAQPALSTAPGPYDAICKDLNNDSWPDIIWNTDGVSPNWDNRLFVSFNPGVAPWYTTNPAVYTIGENPSQIVACDINGDGLIDIASTNTNVNSISVLYQLVDSTFRVFNVPSGRAPYDLVCGDITGDGKLDLIASNFGSNTLTVLENEIPIGSLDAPVFFWSNATVGQGPYGLGIGDVNGDGRLDLVASNVGQNFQGNTISTLLNDGLGLDNHVSWQAQLVTEVGPSPGEVLLQDLDGDDKPELATPVYFYNALAVLKNVGVSTLLAWAPPVYYQVGGGPNGIARGKFDEDPTMDDIVVSNFDANTVSVLFSASSLQPTVVPTRAPDEDSVVGAIIVIVILGLIVLAGLILFMVILFRRKRPTIVADPSAGGEGPIVGEANSTPMGAVPESSTVVDFN